MAIQTNAMKSLLSDAYKAAALWAGLFVSAPTGGNYPTAGTEPTGGSPAYARKGLAAAWGSSANGVVTTTTPPVFDIPSGANVQGAGVFSAVTAGTYYDGAAVTSQAFASQGTYTLTLTYTQS